MLEFYIGFWSRESKSPSRFFSMLLWYSRSLHSLVRELPIDLVLRRVLLSLFAPLHLPFFPCYSTTLGTARARVTLSERKNKDQKYIAHRGGVVGWGWERERTRLWCEAGGGSSSTFFFLCFSPPTPRTQETTREWRIFHTLPSEPFSIIIMRKSWLTVSTLNVVRDLNTICNTIYKRWEQDWVRLGEERENVCK